MCHEHLDNNISYQLLPPALTYIAPSTVTSVMPRAESGGAVIYEGALVSVLRC